MSLDPSANPLSGLLFERMQAMAPGQSALELPPKVFQDMEAEFVDYQEGRSITVRFPVLPRYQNPMGYMQGGMIVAAIDNTLGPLSYLVAPPSVATQLNTSYVRPVTANDEFIIVEGRVAERTRTQLFLLAEVRNQAGKLVAICHATCLILTPPS